MLGAVAGKLEQPPSPPSCSVSYRAGITGLPLDLLALLAGRLHRESPLALDKAERLSLQYGGYWSM